MWSSWITGLLTEWLIAECSLKVHNCHRYHFRCHSWNLKEIYEGAKHAFNCDSTIIFLLNVFIFYSIHLNGDSNSENYLLQLPWFIQPFSRKERKNKSYICSNQNILPFFCVLVKRGSNTSIDNRMFLNHFTCPLTRPDLELSYLI